jgi:thioredoxin-related protein
VKEINLRLLLAATIAAALAVGCHPKTNTETATADKFEWLTDYKQAQQEAKAQNKPLLIEFTGSDWCPPCILLKKEVFTSPEFQSYAAKNFILLEVDFPRGKEQARELAAQNMELAQKFAVEGFPCIVLLGSDGSKLAERVGYNSGSPVVFIAWLEKMRKG